MFLGFSGRGEWIRTTDPSVPNRVLYQAEPRPDNRLILHDPAERAFTSSRKGLHMKREKCGSLSMSIARHVTASLIVLDACGSDHVTLGSRTDVMERIAGQQREYRASRLGQHGQIVRFRDAGVLHS